MSEAPQGSITEQEFKPSFHNEDVSEEATWNPEYDAEIDNAASQLFAEANMAGEPSWSETQKQFTSADWAAVQRRASERMSHSYKTSEHVWAGEAAEWQQVARDAKDAEDRELAGK